MRIVAATPDRLADWATLHAEIFPDEDDAPYRLATPSGDHAGFLAIDRDDAAQGFAEVSVRRDYVNGLDTSPAAFLEAVYVRPAHRRAGVARALVAAVERWSRARGLTELGSDALIDNLDSHAMHRALGFAEMERVVCFRRVLDPEG